MKKYFIFDGVNSRDSGIWLQENIQISGAEPVAEYINVPGRNGDLYMNYGSFHNRTVTMNCFVAGASVSSALHQISRWIMLSGNYQRLEFP